MRALEETWVADDGVRLHARRWLPEKESRGTIVVVHGLGEHSGRYEYAASRFAAAGWETQSFDLRGHGRSPGRHGFLSSYQDGLSDIHGFTSQACQDTPRRPLVLWGHSLGGNLVLNYGMRQDPLPCKLALIATGPLVLPLRNPPWWKRWIGRVASRVWPTLSFDTRMNAAWLTRSEESRQLYDSDPLVFQHISARLAVQSLDAGKRLLADAPRLQVPTLLMHGTGDLITSWKATALVADKVGKNCEFKSWEGFYHELHWEAARDEVLAFMLEWIERQGADDE